MPCGTTPPQIWCRATDASFELATEEFDWLTPAQCFEPLTHSPAPDLEGSGEAGRCHPHTHSQELGTPVRGTSREQQGNAPLHLLQTRGSPWEHSSYGKMPLRITQAGVPTVWGRHRGNYRSTPMDRRAVEQKHTGVHSCKRNFDKENVPGVKREALKRGHVSSRRN